jgi:hypothetical protein
MPNTTPDMVGYRLLQRVLVACGLLIVGVQLLFLGFALDKSQARCQEVQSIRAYILTATKRAITATPTLAYYRDHPDELRAALENLREQRDEFASPLRCSIL